LKNKKGEASSPRHVNGSEAATIVVRMVCKAAMVMIVAGVVMIAMMRVAVASASTMRVLSRSRAGGKGERRDNRGGGQNGLEHQKSLGLARRESSNEGSIAGKA
jgi:hypothetical protein